MEKDRRKENRSALRTLISMSSGGMSQVGVQDVSANGMAILARSDHKVGDYLVLWVGEGATLPVIAQVTDFSPTTIADVRRMGLRIQRGAPSDRDYNKLVDDTISALSVKAERAKAAQISDEKRRSRPKQP